MLLSARNSSEIYQQRDHVYHSPTVYEANDAMHVFVWMCKHQHAFMLCMTRYVYLDSALCDLIKYSNFEGCLIQWWNLVHDSVAPASSLLGKGHTPMHTV